MRSMLLSQNIVPSFPHSSPEEIEFVDNMRKHILCIDSNENLE